ncbi:hypothetical protein N7510_001794 [Penicillium lagena]|uniref:uncharacterized protein n=1 Tax=Penicillium lagena TaxID=94218 RepID=UPI0025425E6D|nr:uncharacterized protein N7510_001794 [Penicillium lagena]KAJ5625485.1 hypothetical protein N7510_001794 [Penicillium lagena]
MEVHVISKQDNRQHATFAVPEASLPKLAASSIRVRPAVISLTSNNLTYAGMGDSLHWWDTYPVLENYPAPYNDSSAWGIVPAWGFATIQESNIPELPNGTMLYGFWPTSSALTDLKLAPSEPQGYWTEVSEHRKQLMTIYNIYCVEPSSRDTPNAQDELERLGWSSVLRAIWSAGYVLSEHVFSAHPQTQPSIHPLGNEVGLDWTADDGDLTSAVVVNLGASTKTARVFTHHASRRAQDVGPLGLLQVTSAVSGLSQAMENLSPKFSTRTIDYSDIKAEGTADWLSGLKPSKIVILDYGARGNALEPLLELIRTHSNLKSCKVVIIAIGLEQKVYTSEEMQTVGKNMVQLGKIQFNTSGVRDTLMKSMSPAKFFEVLNEAWRQLLADRTTSIPDMNLVWGKGVAGTNGLEGGWDALCQGQVKAEEALVYTMP